MRLGKADTVSGCKDFRGRTGHLILTRVRRMQDAVSYIFVCFPYEFLFVPRSSIKHIRKLDNGRVIVIYHIIVNQVAVYVIRILFQHHDHPLPCCYLIHLSVGSGASYPQSSGELCTTRSKPFLRSTFADAWLSGRVLAVMISISVLLYR